MFETFEITSFYYANSTGYKHRYDILKNGRYEPSGDEDGVSYSLRYFDFDKIGIYAVNRLSDNTIFGINHKIKDKFTNLDFVIDKIYYKGGHIFIKGGDNVLELENIVRI